jgi:predicted nucleotidyltransferase
MATSPDDTVSAGEELRRALRSLCEESFVADLYVFGSRASEVAARVRGGVAPDERSSSASDVDVGVRPATGHHMRVDEIVRLATTLETLLGVRRVDVVLLPTAKPFLALEVIRGEILFCADPHAQAEHELYVLRRAGDLVPFQRIREEMALSRYAGP